MDKAICQRHTVTDYFVITHRDGLYVVSWPGAGVIRELKAFRKIWNMAWATRAHRIGFGGRTGNFVMLDAAVALTDIVDHNSFYVLDRLGCALSRVAFYELEKAEAFAYAMEQELILAMLKADLS